jgi:prepilin-type N-terminal cleavage/methylation domain-containing protein
MPGRNCDEIAGIRKIVFNDAPSGLCVPLGRARQGLTLVELLVVIAIIGLLMALLLPAVQAARSSARLAHCSNNQRQIAMALQGHHSQFGHFPYGTHDEESTSIRKRDTWFQQSWPFIEQSKLFAEYMNWQGVWVMDTPAHIKSAVIPGFVCPADPKTPGFGGGGGFRSGANGFQGNYVGCATNGYIRIARTHAGIGAPLIPLEGIFFGNSQTSLSDIRDGSGTTLLLSEVIIRGDASDYGWGGGGGYWGGGQHAGYGFTTMETPNSPVSDRTFQCKSTTELCLPCINVWDSMEKIIIARSHHVGGVLTATADGATRFVANGITPRIWKAMGSRSGASEGNPDEIVEMR